MTVTSQNNRSGPYTGNGATTIFDRTFRADSDDHVKVYISTNGGVEVEQVNGISHTGIGGEAGTVVFATAPTASDQITLIREVPLEQESDYSNQGKVPPENVEADFDKVMMILQDLGERVGRAVSLGINTPNGDAANQLGAIAEAIASQTTAALAAASEALGVSDAVITNAQQAVDAKDDAVQASTTAASAANAAGGSALAAATDRQTAQTAAGTATAAVTTVAQSASIASGAAQTATVRSQAAAQSASGASSSATIAQTAYADFQGALGAAIVLRANGASLELVGGTDINGTAYSGAKIGGDLLQVLGLAQFGGGIQSDNYVAGVSGWRVDAVGNAEFNKLIDRSAITDDLASGEVYMEQSSSLTVGLGSHSVIATDTFSAGKFKALQTVSGKVINPVVLTARVNARYNDASNLSLGRGEFIFEYRVGSTWYFMESTVDFVVVDGHGYVLANDFALFDGGAGSGPPTWVTIPATPHSPSLWTGVRFSVDASFGISLDIIRGLSSARQINL